MWPTPRPPPLFFLVPLYIFFFWGGAGGGGQVSDTQTPKKKCQKGNFWVWGSIAENSAQMP